MCDALNGMFGDLNQRAEFALETGDVVEARFVHIRARGTRLDLEHKTLDSTHTLRLDSWTWKPKGTSCMWIGVLEGAQFNVSNLVLHGQGWWSSQHLRLRGEYDLYLVTQRKGDAVTLVIDTHGRPLDHDILGTDLLALEFVLGCHVQVHRLTAIDTHGQIVGAAGLDFGSGQRGEWNRRCPVAGPSELLATNDESPEEHIWIPSLFERVARHLHDERQDSPLFTGIAAYLHSLSSHIHASYLLVQVGLEALCSQLVAANTHVLVKDSKTWKHFVDEHKSQILEHAIDEDAGRKLLGKVLNAHQAPSSDRVLTALKHFALNIPQVAISEIKRRNAAAHQFVMAKESTARCQELADRLAIVQTLLIAVIAKYLGFDGPIVGWEWAQGRRKVPDWWSWKKLDEARRRYLVFDPNINIQAEELSPASSSGCSMDT
ncbi:uncharacterized protein CMC5_014720 [Chondromyces crocatus]|uniref:ApeA N-terminal domain-containing protein n=2 Tax=Chondromyces crocatus TaxID=52 RepID=A0A0K1E907_CHOCO|nr:uncharacterized protein CMC5_014720 [Chondromyces crocatus]